MAFPQNYFAPPPPLRKLPEIFLMTSHLDSHTTTDVKPDMLSGVQTGNGIPHDRYNIRGIAHVHTNRKDDIFKQRQLMQSFTYILELGQGNRTLTKHTRRWTYSALRYFFNSYFNFEVIFIFEIVFIVEDIFILDVISSFMSSHF